MSWVSDSSALIPSGWLSSAYDGHGALFQDLPTTGEHGPSLQANDTGVSPTAEVRLLLKTTPPLLTSFTLDELGRVVATGPDGTHAGAADHFADGVLYGADIPFYIVIGAGLSGGGTLDDVASSGAVGGGSATVLSGGATMDSIGASGGMSVGTATRPEGRTIYVEREGRRIPVQ